jgi:hypothetical protein
MWDGAVHQLSVYVDYDTPFPYLINVELKNISRFETETQTKNTHNKNENKNFYVGVVSTSLNTTHKDLLKF